MGKVNTKDATHKIQNEQRVKHTLHPCIVLSKKPVYNIDDMDHSNFMRDHRMEGVFCIDSLFPIHDRYPGEVLIDGENIGVPIISGGRTIGIPVRKKCVAYDREYAITYRGARTALGIPIPPFTFCLKTLPKVQPGQIFPEHDTLVLQAAREGTVLLKNENHVLPLGSNSVLNVFGRGGPTYRLGCVGAGKINPRYGIRLEEGIKQYSSMHLNQELFDFYRNEEDILPPAKQLIRARALSDTAVIVITRGTGESQDNRPVKGEYYLSDREKELLKGLSGIFEKNIVVLNTGYPIEMGWAEERGIDAILWSGLNGMAGGRAVAEILEGTVNPSGRLPDTWAFDYYDIPSSRNFYTGQEAECATPSKKGVFINTVYEEGLYVGYRYFDTFHIKTAYAFGHGLSYTVFHRQVGKAMLTDPLHLCLDVRVQNAGPVEGKETVLLFAGVPDGKLEQSAKRLVAFGKTRTLQPGEEETLHLDIPPQRLHSYDEETASWIIETGDITLYLGGSVGEAVPCCRVTIPEPIMTKQVKNRIVPPFKVHELSKQNPAGTYPAGKLSGKVNAKELPYRRSRKMTKETRLVSGSKPDTVVTFPMVVQDPSLLEPFVLQMSDYELCRMSVGARTGWGYNDNGFAGSLYTGGALSKYQLPEYFMADGNNGLNLYEETIGFPVSNVMCATFNEALVYEEGRAIAKEAIAHKIDCILAPAMNLHRNPLCGRHAEYFSEDPFLAGRMGGMESKGIEDMGLASVMKHFFGNNAENDRMFNHSIVPERVARELYLQVFQVAMEVQMPSCVMTGYNPANGCWCAADEELLEGILREEMGFTGFVMTDWGTGMMHPNDQIAQAGNSWIAPGTMNDKHVKPLLKGLAGGTLDRERLRRNVYDLVSILAAQMRKK